MIPIPPADSDGYWHYTYVTYHPDTGEWYGGKHTTNDLNDGYRGSGNWVKNHPTRTELIIEIVEFFYSEDHAYAAEAALVDFVVIDADPLCRNKTDGGFGISRAAAAKLVADPKWQQKNREHLDVLHADPRWRHKVREAAIRNAADPKYQQNHSEAIRRLFSDPEWRRNNYEANIRRAADPEYQQNHRAAMRRLAADPAWRHTNLESVAQRSADPEWRRSVGDANRQKATDPNWLRKNREANIRKAADPEWQRKFREGIARREANRRAAIAQEQRR